MIAYMVAKMAIGMVCGLFFMAMFIILTLILFKK